MNKTAKGLRLYTHTHTHTHTRILSEQNMRQGGSREHRDVAILPRDCE